MTPVYLCELVSIKKLSRKFRSSSQILLQVPVSRFKSYGDCVFSVAAPTLWNRLPANIRNASSLENFKSLLKPHLKSDLGGIFVDYGDCEGMELQRCHSTFRL